jgi:hypothetical protein
MRYNVAASYRTIRLTRVRLNSVGRCLFAVPDEIHRKGGKCWYWSRQGSTSVTRMATIIIARRDEPSVLRLRDMARHF